VPVDAPTGRSTQSVPVLLSVEEGAELPEQRALASFDFCLIEDPVQYDALRDSGLAQASADRVLDPYRLVLDPGPSTAERSFADRVASLEFRYRAVCCIDRESLPEGRLLLFALGRDAQRRGPTDLQGATMLLLHPGAAAEFELAEPAGGATRVRITQLQLESEPDTTLGGALSAAGRRLGCFENPEPAAEDRELVAELDVDLAPGTSRLAIEALGPTDGQYFVRLAKIEVLALESAPNRVSSRTSRTRAALRRVRGLLGPGRPGLR